MTPMLKRNYFKSISIQNERKNHQLWATLDCVVNKTDEVMINKHMKAGNEAEKWFKLVSKKQNLVFNCKMKI